VNRFPQLHNNAVAHGLHFLLVGGHAVGQHGYGRMTEDVDLLIAAEEKEAWHELAAAAGYRLFRDGGNFSQWEAPDDQTDDLDFMIVNAGTFTKLQAESVSAQLFGLEMRIPRLEHLLALKFHALRGNKAIRSLKDMDDVINLIEINRLDVFSEEFKALTLRYGDQEILDKLQAIIRPS